MSPKTHSVLFTLYVLLGMLYVNSYLFLNMVSISEFLSFFNYYFFIISGMINRSYSERDGIFMKGTKKVTKTVSPTVHIGKDARRPIYEFQMLF